MTLPPFVFIAPSKSAPEMGAGFILGTKHPPYYLGRIVKLKPSPYAFIEYKNAFSPLIYSEVQGYSILIVFAGSLGGNKIRVSGVDWQNELQNTFNQMADFMLKEKIFNNLGYYKKYLQ